jgi:hypothetical protein
MRESEVLCSHCRKALERGEHAVVLHGGETRGITFGEARTTGECWHATCFQIARVQRAIEELGDAES